MGSTSHGLPEPLVIEVGQARLAGVRLGPRTAPHVVFLHAGIADHRSWTEVLTLLAPDMDLLAYDRRGFGTTTAVAEAHDQTVDLLAVLDDASVDRAVLVGNSRGGQIALDAALTHPERVAALVLVAPGISGAPPVDPVGLRAEEVAYWSTLEAVEAAGDLEALNEGEVRLWLDGLGAAEGRVDGPRRVLALDMNRIALAAESPGHEPHAVDAWHRLEEIACPVLVVVGDLDLSHVVARGHQLAERIAGARVELMAGAAHLPAFEQPEAFAALLRRFLSD